MKQHRKCDTAKYRRRREKEKTAHVERKARQKRIDAADHQRWEKIRLERERVMKEWHEQEQLLVNILAKRLYQLSPEHARAAHAKATLRTWYQIGRIFSGGLR